MWLIGDNHRGATGAIVLLGLVTFATCWPPKGLSKTAFVTLGAAAVVLAGLAFATGSLTPLSLLLVVIVVWAIPAAVDVWHSTHHPIAT